MFDPKANTNLQISDVARHAGVSASTIRVWEQQDLITPTYTQTGRRSYSRSDVETAITIKRMRAVEGMKIAEIKKALAKRRPARPHRTAKASDSAPISIVGDNLRKLRQARKLTIRDVAKLVGTEASVLASIERTSLGINMPLLKRLASFYDVTLNKLMGVELAPERSDREIVMHDHGVLLPQLGLGVLMERLGSGRDIMNCKRWRIEPGIHSKGSYRHEGEEFLVVIAGEFEITIDDSRTHRLTKGDTIYFRSNMFHAWRNPGRDTAELIWIGVGDSF